MPKPKAAHGNKSVLYSWEIFQPYGNDVIERSLFMVAGRVVVNQRGGAGGAKILRPTVVGGGEGQLFF